MGNLFARAGLIFEEKKPSLPVYVLRRRLSDMEMHGLGDERGYDPTKDCAVVELKMRCFQQTRKKLTLQALTGKTNRWKKRCVIPLKSNRLLIVLSESQVWPILTGYRMLFVEEVLLVDQATKLLLEAVSQRNSQC